MCLVVSEMAAWMLRQPSRADVWPMILRILAKTTNTLPMVALESSSQLRINHGNMRIPGLTGSTSVRVQQREFQQIRQS
ncbi:hypothetical protein MTO96_045666 [Rhipicephalus appendiculatus]